MKGENLSAELAWFHVFKAMIDDGEVAKIGASAFTIYCVIKHTPTLQRAWRSLA